MKYLQKMNELFGFGKKSEPVSDQQIIKTDIKSMNDDATRVENFPVVLLYICDDIDRSIKLTTFLKKPLTQLFGKHNTTFRGEFFYYVWIVEFEGNIFEICTSNHKGTQFQIVEKQDEDKSKVIIRFLRKMEELLDSVKSFR